MKKKHKNHEEEDVQGTKPDAGATEQGGKTPEPAEQEKTSASMKRETEDQAPAASAGGAEDSEERRPDEASESNAPPNPEAAVAAMISAVTAELRHTQDRQLRLQADFDNFRKRVVRERQEIQTRSREDVLLEMLPVLDHLELALAAAAEHSADKQIVEGFRLVGQQLMAVLTRFGLEPIEAAGATFDHNIHEAISHMATADKPEGAVIVQARRGYRVGERLLRAAQVIVSSGAPAAVETMAGE